MAAAIAKETPRPFTHIDTWVFDLDNTLYPHHVNLWQQVDARIGEFIGNFLKVDPVEARRIQKDYYLRYGTSMRGMMTEHGVHARRLPRLCASDRSFAAAAESGDGGGDRQIARAQTDPDQRLRPTMPTRFWRGSASANSSRRCFDIVAAELEPKPAPQTYRKFLVLHGVDPLKSAMFEDLARTSWCRINSA